jgi:hypothetical protein
MPRQRLPDRRYSTTERVRVAVSTEGQHKTVLVTVGFDRGGNPREVFCADWRASGTLHSVVIDACILLSRLYQHGDAPDEIAATLSSPPTVVGSIAAHVARVSGKRPIELPPADPSPASSPASEAALPLEMEMEMLE